MENIKIKAKLIDETRRSSVDITSVITPIQEPLLRPKIIPLVNEEFGWSKLSSTELNEFLEAEAFAAHIGQFIHHNFY